MYTVTQANRELRKAIDYRREVKKKYGPDHVFTCAAENRVKFLRQLASDLRMREHAEMWANGEFEND
jgi:hypothetical protein